MAESLTRRIPWKKLASLARKQNGKPRNFGNSQSDNPCSYEINDAEKHPRSKVVTSIREMLQKLPPISQKCSIYRVPKRLLNFHRTAYTPQLISVGPFHHRRKHLEDMEQLKLRFLNSYLGRINKELDAVVMEAQKLENKARHCYAEPIHMDRDEFVKMMLVDGCFVVELMMTVDDPQSGLDPLLYEPLSIDLYRDLTMLENQLPFFVLQSLFDLYHPDPPTIKKYASFNHLAHNFFIKASIDPCNRHLIGLPMQTVHHLVDFLNFCYIPFNLPPTSAATGNKTRLNLPPTATELHHAGVVFKKAAEDKHIMDISFKNGVLEIPSFEIHDVFEPYMRNLMAFEHFSIGNEQRYVIHYVSFLDALISTEKDASLFVKAKIITNTIGGNNEEIAKLFNDLCKDVAVPSHRYYFDDISEELHKHCRMRRHRWMASLRRDYFNTPWALISCIAAFIVIVLDFIQTISSVVSLEKSIHK